MQLRSDGGPVDELAQPFPCRQPQAALREPHLRTPEETRGYPDVLGRFEPAAPATTARFRTGARRTKCRPMTLAGLMRSLAWLRCALSVQGMTPISCQIIGDCPASRMQVAITIKIATQNRAIGKPNPSREMGTDERCSLIRRFFAIVAGMFESLHLGATPKVSVCGQCQRDLHQGISLKSREHNRREWS